MEEFYDDLIKELECPVCMETMGPPIMQCHNGHSICSSCRSRVTRCPQCQADFSSARNYALEKMSEKMPVDCRNKKFGCQVKLTLDKLRKHEELCSNKGYLCELAGCSWRGTSEDLLDHWSSKPQNIKLYVDTYVCRTKLNENNNFANLIIYNDRLFWLKCYKTYEKVFWAVQSVQGEVEPADYYFEIEIYKPGMYKKRITVSEYCSGLQEGFGEEVFENLNSVSFPKSYLLKFLDENSVLMYRISVMQLSEGGGFRNKTRNQGKNTNNAKPYSRRDNIRQKFRKEGPKNKDSKVFTNTASKQNPNANVSTSSNNNAGPSTSKNTYDDWIHVELPNAVTNLNLQANVNANTIGHMQIHTPTNRNTNISVQSTNSNPFGSDFQNNSLLNRPATSNVNIQSNMSSSNSIYPNITNVFASSTNVQDSFLSRPVNANIQQQSVPILRSPPPITPRNTNSFASTSSINVQNQNLSSPANANTQRNSVTSLHTPRSVTPRNTNSFASTFSINVQSQILSSPANANTQQKSVTSRPIPPPVTPRNINTSSSSNNTQNISFSRPVTYSNVQTATKERISPNVQFSTIKKNDTPKPRQKKDDNCIIS